MNDVIYLRNCLYCGREIKYKNKLSFEKAKKDNKRCKSCIRLGDNNPMSGMTGDKNPFFGKTHSIETKRKLSAERSGVPIPQERRKAVLRGLKKAQQLRVGVSNYESWVKRYGKEIADQKMEQYRKRVSINTSGKNNPMFGKPSPNGSGQGWKGWYRSHYFRSLRELSYMIYLDENSIAWETAERKDLTIAYKDPRGNDRTYRADFLLNKKKLIEIKPTRLHRSPLISLKTKAAQGFCAASGLEFEIVDCEIDCRKLKAYFDKGEIIFDRDYKDRFLEFCRK